MSYSAQVILDTVRCLTLAGLVTWAGWKIGARLPAQPGWRWVLLVAPLCTPTLLVSYTYAPLALWLTGMPPALLAFYSALVALKFIPLAALARRFFPPALSTEARFCAQLAAAPRSFALRALGPMPWATALVIFLLTFTDFELASLLSIKTWTVMLFDAHAGGLALNESVARAALPLTLGLAAIVGLAWLLRRTPGRASEPRGSQAPRWVDASLLAVAALLSFAPLARIGGQAVTALGTLGVQEVLGEDVLASLAGALAATGGAWLLLHLARRKLTRLALVLPGLLGALVLALVLLAALHATPPLWFPLKMRAQWLHFLDFLTGSPVPLLLGEMLLLLPIALVLRAVLDAQRPGESLHLARMAGSRRLVWELDAQPRAAALALLFALAYAEFTAAAILAPIGITPVFVRLHNLAHYGQSAALSAMLLAATLAPAALLALTLGGARLYARRDVR